MSILRKLVIVLVILTISGLLYSKDENITVNAVKTYKLTGMDMVVIPGDSFMMGSPDNEKDHGIEEKLHKVTVSSFSIGMYEVTQKQYRLVTGKNPSKFRGDNLPVERVDWFDAVDYCNRLSEKAGLKPYYTIIKNTVIVNGGDGFRLPTEAEWEYACRGGTITSYHWGKDINGDYAWYKENSGDKTHPVGRKKPNVFGLHDMTGNVWEWCWDWSGIYGGTVTDPQGAEKGDRRILRGGGWNSIAALLRSASRMGTFPSADSSAGSPAVGFRIARSAVEGKALLRVCPDVKIINRMPGIKGISEYYIVKGQRREIDELDNTWVWENCRFEEKTVY